jgi:ATP-dependent helicase HrpB
VPEVLRVDLGRTLLELAAWNLPRSATLAWLDPPPPATLERARTLLVALGALGPSHDVTDVGRRMLAMPVAPRLARMLVEAEDLGAHADGALVAALASERDIVRAARAFGGPSRDWPPGPSDLLLRMDLFADAARAGFSAHACDRLGLDVRAVRAVEHTRRQLARRGRDGGAASGETLRRCVLAGFPDRVSRRRERGGARAVMVGGTGVVLAPESVVRESELVRRDRRRRRAAPVGRRACGSRARSSARGSTCVFPGSVISRAARSRSTRRAAARWRGR